MRYFFDSIDQSGEFRDEAGVECASHEAARRLAEAALAEMVRDAMPGGGEQTFRIAVRMGADEPIFEASLRFETAWRIDR